MNPRSYSRETVLLLVEDNPGDVRLAQEALKDGRIQNKMYVVGDGEEAMRFLRREGEFVDVERPDMVLLDLNLPKKDGLEVLAEIQADLDLRSLPVVILTASKVEERILKQYNLPTECFITKPLLAERYLDAVHCFPQLGLVIVNIAGA